MTAVNYKGLLWVIKCDYQGQVVLIEGVNKVEVGTQIGLKWDMEDVHLIKEEKDD